MYLCLGASLTHTVLGSATVLRERELGGDMAHSERNATSGQKSQSRCTRFGHAVARWRKLSQRRWLGSCTRAPAHGRLHEQQNRHAAPFIDGTPSTSPGERLVNMAPWLASGRQAPTGCSVRTTGTTKERGPARRDPGHLAEPDYITQPDTLIRSSVDSLKLRGPSKLSLRCPAGARAQVGHGVESVVPQRFQRTPSTPWLSRARSALAAAPSLCPPRCSQPPPSSPPP